MTYSDVGNLVPRDLIVVWPNWLVLDSIHQNHLGHLIATYITDLLVSFQLRLGLAVHIVKFRPKLPEKLGCTLVV